MARNDTDIINHLHVVRVGVNGVGTLKLTVYSYNFYRSSVLPEITLASNIDRLPTVLANFEAQKMCLEFKTTETNEFFTISRITPFVKPVSMEYPR